MCLNLKEDAEVKIAEENIACYKSLYNGGRSVHTNFHYINYRVNRDVVLSPRRPRFGRTRELDEGYHSRKNNNRDSKKHLFVIPKGAQYFEGMENRENLAYLDGYVSSTIIYIGKNNAFNRLIGKLFYGVTFQSEKKMQEDIRNRRNENW